MKIGSRTIYARMHTTEHRESYKVSCVLLKGKILVPPHSKKLAKGKLSNPSRAIYKLQTAADVDHSIKIPATILEPTADMVGSRTIMGASSIVDRVCQHIYQR